MGKDYYGRLLTDNRRLITNKEVYFFMNNLTTRKIVLGLLMALVLALGVQGIAGAETVTRSSGDLNHAVEDTGEFQIQFTVSGTKSGDTLSIPNRSSGLVLQSIDNFGIPETYTSSSIKLHETNPATVDDNRPTLSDISYTLTYISTSVGEKTITIGGTSFTVYIVKKAYQVSLSDTVSLLGMTNGVGAGYGGTDDFKIHTGDSRYNLVNYDITTGEGMVYIKEGTREGDEANNLTTSSRADVWLRMGGTSNTVTARVVTTRNETEAVYILRVPQLAVATDSSSAPTEVTAEIAPLTGNPGEVIVENAIRVSVMQSRVEDNKVNFDTPVANVPVKFDVVDKSPTGGWLIPQSGTTIVDLRNNEIDAVDIPRAARTLYVRTTATGGAPVRFQLGTAQGTSEITVSVAGTRVNIKKTVDVIIGDDISTQLERSSNTSTGSGDSKRFHLVASVTDKDGDPLWGVPVTFQTQFGNLTSTPTGETIGTTDAADGAAVNDFGTGATTAATAAMEGLEVTDVTSRSGLAQVVYDLGTNTGRQEIDASIYDDDPDRRREVTFFVNGPAPPPPPPPPGTDADTTTNTVTVFPGSLEGAPGSTATLAVAADTTTVRVTASATFTAAGGTVTGNGASRVVTLPNTAGDYSLTASASRYTDRTVPITVTGPTTGTVTQLGTLSATSLGGQLVRVTATNSDGTTPAGALVVTLSGASFVTTTAEILGGSGNVAATLPTAQGSYRLTVSATGYGSTPVILTVGAGTTTTTTTTTRTVTGEADSIEIDGQRRRSGTVNEAARLRVRVLDANDNGVSDVRVTFRVLAPGRGTFSGSRGNGRAVPDQTDRSGYASASLTPSDDGDLIVRASAAGVRDPVTFIIAVGEAAGDPETPAPSEDVAPSRDISPVVHLGVASRPPMLWVDGGAIYALVGASEQRFAPGVDNALNIAIGGGKVYWTEKTGESGGTINSANLNGSGVTELASILAVPMGIAVDVAGSKLYWTNSRGRIQSADLDGSGITNELQNLPSPMDIALARGLVYWTQGNGSVRLVNLTGQRIVRDISTGTDTPGSLVIGGSKVYWTEMTGDSSGTVNSANLNGTGATQLASILAAPSGIAVDTARSKLYWTNSRGRIQSADLDGSKITNVVSGLGSPGELVLSNSITAPAAAPAETASGSKYDVNGDGAVDAKDSDALIVAVAAEITDAKYDVNGDGTVTCL